jgi:hypothetical protein
VNQEFLLTDYFLRISPLFHILDLLLLTLHISIRHYIFTIQHYVSFGIYFFIPFVLSSLFTI